ncbi:MAG: hypothetical protein IPJ85_12565 [Flavobacteriales bacterium]|nr:hypothetical protein [Flavobacteriales bacterium]
MKRELQRLRQEPLISWTKESNAYASPALDNLAGWLRHQPGVVGADWDKCDQKPYPLGSTEPVPFTLGLFVSLRNAEHERIYTLMMRPTGPALNPLYQMRAWRFGLGRKRIVAREWVYFLETQRRICMGLQ